MRLPESMLLWTKMSLKKFHCDGAWLRGPFFDKSSGWDSFLSLVLHASRSLSPFKNVYVCPDSPFAVSHVCKYRLFSLSLFYLSLPSKQSACILSGSLDRMGEAHTSKSKCPPMSTTRQPVHGFHECVVRREKKIT